MKLRLAGASLNQTPFDWAGNERRILECIAAAQAQGVQILALPELCTSGYGCEDAFFDDFVSQSAMAVLRQVLPHTKNIAVCVGLPMRQGNVLYNCVAVVCDSKVVGILPKKHLAGSGLHYEPRWFRAWPVGTQSTIDCFGQTVPFGDLHFDFGGLKLGLEICEEAWVADRPGLDLAKCGVSVIVNPSASHFAFGKLAARKDFVGRASKDFKVAYVYSNLVGNESGRVIFDGGTLIAHQGAFVTQGERFSYQEWLLTVADVEVSPLKQGDHSNQKTLSACVKHPFQFQGANDSSSSTPVAAWEQSPHLKFEEFTRAVSLGLFDFLRKSKQRGFVVSLSGGIDSGATAALCRSAIDLAAQQLGLDGLKKRLSHIKDIQSLQSTDEVAKHLISCAYQSTKNSSTATLEAAKSVAQEVGASFYSWTVDALVDGYQAIAEKALGQPLTWQRHDVAMQNIQARTRSPAIWMLANLKGALLLATSNRSEAAVGYATMDGDTSGGLSPLAGIDKHFLRQWAQWMQSTGPAGLRALASFGKVLAQPPTAELRPAEQHQSDESDLMPYEILDQIERSFVRDKLSPQQCLDVLKKTRPVAEHQQLLNWVQKFFRLWCQNQWKRERYAPSFHLDDESLDPKTWCRFPILSSGFERELAELKL